MVGYSDTSVKTKSILLYLNKKRCFSTPIPEYSAHVAQAENAEIEIFPLVYLDTACEVKLKGPTPLDSRCTLTDPSSFLFDVKFRSRSTERAWKVSHFP